MKNGAAIGTLIKNDSGIGRHLFRFSKPALWTGDDGSRFNHSCSIVKLQVVIGRIICSNEIAPFRVPLHTEWGTLLSGISMTINPKYNEAASRSPGAKV